ncbi:MAG: FmdE family protein [Syntrophobacteraceae bacterium]
MNIGTYSYEDYLQLVGSFHGTAAPGLVLGGFMVEMGLRHTPKGVLFDAICETTACLPDAIQLLTPCTIGNGWLKIVSLGRFALSLYDKYEGNGVRVYLDPEKLKRWPEIEAWLFKLKTKAEQDKDQLLDQIREGGFDVCGIQPINVQPHYLKKKSRGRIVNCSMCGEPYPALDGGICRGCQGETPYVFAGSATGFSGMPSLKAVPVEEAVGKTALHDMTAIIPGKSKGPAFTRGQKISAGDLCRLQKMGRGSVYVEEDNSPHDEWIHENEAALAFAKAMAGDGVCFQTPPREGKVGLTADRDGLFTVDEERLELFNMVPGIMCASQNGYTLVRSGRILAGTRAIPLFLSRKEFSAAMAILEGGPLFRVLPLRKAKVGILVTGTEVFQGHVEDKFIPIIAAKVEQLGCEVVKTTISPDERAVITEGVRGLIESGADLIITTAGLSVDPDDVTRQALVDSGAVDMLYGAPILPGAMTLLARIDQTQVMGVPACALYHKITSFDLLLPRLLAGVPVTRRDLAKFGHGALCLDCKACTFPKCPFGR